MLDRIKMVKRKLDESIEMLCEVSWMFSKQPGKDFTRNWKLPFPKLVSFLLAMKGGTLTTELLKWLDVSQMLHSEVGSYRAEDLHGGWNSAAG